jgi:ribosomal-protein-alanine N-acetyltransferase
MNLRGTAMKENGNLLLQTERLILREVKEEDWHSVHEYGSDPEVVKYLPFGPNTEDETKAFIRRVIVNQKEQPRLSYSCALVIRSTNKLIGICRIHIVSTDNKEGEIGYGLNRSYWNQGYMTEAAQRVVSFGFEELGLHRIYATCEPANTGSSRVMEKIGMQREGHLRDHKLMKGTWRDSLLYAVLDQEYKRRPE